MGSSDATGRERPPPPPPPPAKAAAPKVDNYFGSDDDETCAPCVPVSMQASWCGNPVSRPSALEIQSCAAVLPPELWTKVWDGLAQGFFTKGFPTIDRMEGACKCGKLGFEVTGILVASFQCHCHMCRRYWSQATPTPTLWVRPAHCLTVTKGEEYLGSWTVEKLSRNLRGQATVQFCKACGTNIDVNFSDPAGDFALMWPNNFKYDEWGDISGKGDKARHGYAEMFKPRFHAHYENRAYDIDDSLPKLADIWMEGLPMMNSQGDIIGEIKYPLPGFENGWMEAPTGSKPQEQAKL